MRIEEHPILDFDKGTKVKFYYDGKEVEGYEGESIAAALHSAGVRVLSHSHEKHRPRGFYCAIGNCGQCTMEVDGVSNVRTCIEPLREGMNVKTQKDKGGIL